MKIDNNRFNEALERMCDDYCLWPLSASSEDVLELHCNECPLNNIGNEEYWKEGAE